MSGIGVRVGTYETVITIDSDMIADDGPVVSALAVIGIDAMDVAREDITVTLLNGGALVQWTGQKVLHQKARNELLAALFPDGQVTP